MAAPTPKTLADLSPEVIAYSNGPVLLAQTAPFFAVGVVVFFGRCYSRTFTVKSFGKDDWAMLGAVIFATVCFVCYTIEISLGIGKHLAVIQADPARYHELLKVRWIHMLAVVIGISLVKISVAFTLQRLAIRRLYIGFLWSVIVFIAAFTVACVGTLIFQCLPVAAAWDLRLRPPPRGVGTAKCFTQQTFRRIGLFNGVVNILTDFLLALLPVPLIWKLHMPLRTRISLIIILSLGIFAAIAGIVRQMSIPQTRDPEPWIRDSYAIWNFLELYMGIIAASLPANKALFNQFFEATHLTPKEMTPTRFRSSTSYIKQKDYPLRDMRQEESREEIILPDHEYSGGPNGIMVTRTLQIS